MLRLPLCAIALLMFCNNAVAASAPNETATPPALRDWQGWVLKDLDYRACPFLATQMQNDASGYICAWPGRLMLNITNKGADFSVHWHVDAPSWVVLPGSQEHWPQQVTVNRQPQPVLVHHDTPALWLAPGSYDIAGTIPWHDRPQSLRVSTGIGLVSLNIDGKAVVPVQRKDDEITLGRSTAVAPETDNMELQIFRKLTDGVPAELVTQIRLTVSGPAREETIGPVLPVGFEAIALDGHWFARLDNDGRLHMQVQPGSTTFTLQARAAAPLTTLTARVPAAPWPKQEIWSYEAAPRLRTTHANAAISVDPRQVHVPEKWRTLPAFALGDSDKLIIEEHSRGLAPNEANRLTLKREAWLHFAGDGWHARDVIGGNMVQGWRLDVAAPFVLERAAANASPRRGGGSEALLVTRGAAPELSGVEWRTPAVNLAGSLSIAAVSSLPVSGWQQSFDKIDTTLHFPFGYKLLGAPGADSVEGSWMSRWTLLDVFITAITVLLAWRLLGVIGALAATSYLLLGYQEAGSPLWTLLIVLALALIARVLPEGKLRHATELLRRVALLVFILIALPFLADQVRYALYPQLESLSGNSLQEEISGAYLDYKMGGMRGEVAATRDAQSVPMESSITSEEPKGEVRNFGDRRLPENQKTIDRYSQSTVVQTGEGEPNWTLGGTAMLSWNGPVLPTQRVHLLIAPPWLVRPLRIVLAVLLVWLAWQTYRMAPLSLRRVARDTSAGILGLLLAANLAFTRPAHAQTYPPDELLQQLRERLIEAPKCAPACASVAQMQATASGDTVSVVLEVHAGERLAIPLPGMGATEMLKSVKVDSAADTLVARRADGTSWIAVDRGVHRIELEYVSYTDTLTLNFTLKPARVLFNGQGWTASGIEDDRLLSGTLHLVRTRGAATGEPKEVGPQQFPPYVRVVRSLSLGLDWSVSTQVERLSPATGGFTLALPLLVGEHVSTSGIKVQSGSAIIALPDSADRANWNSTLDKSETFQLTAPALTDHAEVWRVLISPTWHVEFSGVPNVGIDTSEDAGDDRSFEFHPLPGEMLTLKITRPAPLQGTVRAIDAVNLNSEIGQRSTTSTLNLNLRASQGGEQAINLPKDAEVISVKRDHETLNLRTQNGKLSLPVKPGRQRYDIRFRDNTAVGFSTRTPQVELGLPAANIALTQHLPADRWLLAAFGPPVGPAVLYWGELAVMIVIAFALARTRRTPLKFHDWLLLGFGFSTFSWGALLVVVAWLFAFDWRARSVMPQSQRLFNLSQIGLVVLTFVAMACLISAIPQGLLGQPDMHVVGNGSSTQALLWFTDRTTDALPQASTISVPLWVYKVLMLVWALWLANALIGWLRDGFAAWMRGGYWQSRQPVTTS